MKKASHDEDIRPQIVRHMVSGSDKLIPTGPLAGEGSLPYWAVRYLEAEVYGVQSRHTFDAKSRDLSGFVRWFHEVNGHVMIEQWMPRDTQGYLDHLDELGRAPGTINRAFTSIRRFARWCSEQKNSPFLFGLPTKGIKERSVDEADAKKLGRREVHQLFKAADSLVLTEKHKNSRPRRNKAVLALLYYTGLRVSELTGLKRSQYDGKYLRRLKRKGRKYQDVYLNSKCRAPLDDYLDVERPRDDPDDELGPLFLSTQGAKHLNRSRVNQMLRHLAEEANKHCGDGEKITAHPHQLRHTFGSIYREKTGSDTETAAALGHAGLKYVGRYVRKTQAEREQVLEEAFDLGVPIHEGTLPLALAAPRV